MLKHIATAQYMEGSDVKMEGRDLKLEHSYEDASSRCEDGSSRSVRLSASSQSGFTLHQWISILVLRKGRRPGRTVPRTCEGLAGYSAMSARMTHEESRV